MTGRSHYGFGSKCYKLAVSKSSPLRPIKLTSNRRLATSLMGQTVTLQCYSVGSNEGRRLGTWRFASMAMQELECGLAKGPRRLQTKGMRGVGKDDLLHVREIAR
jgi:hypothetical protein